MNAAREHVIRRWYRQNASNSSVTYAGTPGPFGIVTDGECLREPDMATLAEFIRRKEGPPLVRLVLPNPVTAVRHHLIRRVVTQEGGMAFSIPSRTLLAASIEVRSIQVVHTQESNRLLRAPEQLIKAKSQYYRWRTERYSRMIDYREAYYLSGYDANERGLSYFFCELPPGVEPTTVAEAYEALKPESVRLAIKAGRTVKRQGDMFFIRMPRRWSPGDADRSSMRLTRHLNGRIIVEDEGDPYLHRSNHAGTEVVRIDGLTYTQGTVRHVPRGRAPDHRPLRLGHRWWLCVRNTVPLAE